METIEKDYENLRGVLPKNSALQQRLPLIENEQRRLQAIDPKFGAYGLAATKQA